MLVIRSWSPKGKRSMRSESLHEQDLFYTQIVFLSTFFPLIHFLPLDYRFTPYLIYLSRLFPAPSSYFFLGSPPLRRRYFLVASRIPELACLSKISCSASPPCSSASSLCFSPSLCSSASLSCSFTGCCSWDPFVFQQILYPRTLLVSFQILDPL